jgi:2'-5' RNA ligase
MSAVRRLFLAIPLCEAQRRRLAAVRDTLPVGDARVKWVPEEQLHLTVKFLGETPESAVAPLRAAVDRIAGSVAQFELEVGGLGCFPPRGPVRIIWVGGKDGSGALDLVVQEFEGEAALLGFAPENRTFSVHFTIGRVKSDDPRGKLRPVIEATDIEPQSLPVRELILYESHLSPRGPHYEALHRASLGSCS